MQHQVFKIIFNLQNKRPLALIVIKICHLANTYIYDPIKNIIV